MLPALLSASWLLEVEKALDSPEYCKELSVLVKSADSDVDQEVLEVLEEILKVKCNCVYYDKTTGNLISNKSVH